MNLTFAALSEYGCGMPHLNELRKAAANHPIEGVWARPRALSCGLASEPLVDEPTR